jgi:hypothetical protein
VPMPNCFNDMRDNDYGYIPYVGMTRCWKEHYVGNADAFTGAEACGDADAWLNGVSYYNPPPPCRCPQCMCVPVQEVPSGSVDGMNRHFTLSQSPLSAASVQFFINGILQIQGVNYSISSTNIYLNGGSTPKSGDSVLACYQVPGTP